MFFIILTFLTAFSIEGLGTYVSVIGLSTLFGANPIIIVLAVALDAGKLVVVTLLYSRWKILSKIMKTYALFAAIITMIITSAGAAGYLSGEFQKAILGTQEGSLKVDVLKGQIAKYEERKKQIDAQIAVLPEKTTVTQRLRLMNGFKTEQEELQVKIADIDKQLPDLQIRQIGVETKAGPILYIAKAFDIPVESAVKYVILLIIFVFDPLAVFLIIAGNFLLHQRRTKGTSLVDADLLEEQAEQECSAPNSMESPLTEDDAALHAMPIPDGSLWSTGAVIKKRIGGAWVPLVDAIKDPTPPIFEVLQASPVKPVYVPAEPDASLAKVYSEDDIAWLTREGPMAKTHDDTHIDKHYIGHTDPENVDAPREVITREQLTSAVTHFPHVSSLNSVAPGPVTFEDNPQSEVRGTYSNLK